MASNEGLLDAAATEGSDKAAPYPPASAGSAVLPIASLDRAALTPSTIQQMPVDGARPPGSPILAAEPAVPEMTAAPANPCDAPSPRRDAAVARTNTAALPDTCGGANAHSVLKEAPPPSSAGPAEARGVSTESNAPSSEQDTDMDLANAVDSAASTALRGPASHTPTADSTPPTVLALPAHSDEATSTIRESGTIPSLSANPAVRTILAPPPGSASVPNISELAANESGKRGSKRKGTAYVAGRSSKRSKAISNKLTSGSSSRTVSIANSQNSSATLVGTENAPEWVTDALKFLQSVALGLEWDALLASWFAFEQGSGFEGSVRLGTRSRPRVVGEWIKYARTDTFRHEIKNVSSFANEFNTWWASLQPAWRTDDASRVLRRDDGDWECLRRPGLNGLLSILAGLFFWGCAVQKSTATARSAWLDAVDDVSYSIAQLLKL